jgi:hypothetical protein
VTPDNPDRDLANRLLAMAARDIETRDRLAQSGQLENGYHPQMRAVHEANADELSQIIMTIGWPDSSLVGPEAAEAAWLVVQHAISRPQLQRAVAPLLASAVERGLAPAAQLAYLTDRICYFEGRPQIYGTQFVRGDDGEWTPYPIEDLGKVNERRAAVGLDPLAQAVSRHRAVPAPRPTSEQVRRHRVAADEFAHEVGWR